MRVSYSERPKAKVDYNLRDMQNSSYPAKTEFNNCFIIHSKYIPVLKSFPISMFDFLLSKKTQSCPQVFLVNGSIICSGLNF